MMTKEVVNKFEGATEEELADYVESSHERGNETAEQHRQRVQLEEAELVKLAASRRAEAETPAPPAEVDEAE